MSTTTPTTQNVKQAQNIPDCLQNNVNLQIFEGVLNSHIRSYSYDDYNIKELFKKFGINEFISQDSISEFKTNINGCRAVRINIIGKYLGFNPESMFNIFPISTTLMCNEMQIVSIPQSLWCVDAFFTLQSRLDENDYNGKLSHVYCNYIDNNGNEIIIIATRHETSNEWCKKTIVIDFGHGYAPNFPLAYSKIDRHPNATVIFFMDFRLAMRLVEMAKEAKINLDRYIISSVYGCTKNVFSANLTVLSTRKVVVVPELTPEGFCDPLCKGAGIRGVTSRFPVFRTG